MVVAGGTIVVLMGAAARGEIAQRLIEHGMDPTTPVTAVTWGTRPEQVAIRSTLGGLGEAAVLSPVTIVIGAVAALADDLAWFKLPLAGRSVVVAAPTGESGDEETFGDRLATAAARTGATVTSLVTGSRVSPADGGAALRDAIARAQRAAWVTFASAASVEAFAAVAPHTFAFGDALVGVVGAATAAAFERAFDRPADLVADPPNGASLAAAIGTAPEEGATEVIVIGAEDPRPELPDGLRVGGWQPVSTSAYRLGPPPHSDLSPRTVVDEADAVVCTSPSAATYLVTHGGLIAARAPVVAIGPTTADALRSAGLPADRLSTAESPAVEHIVAALLTCLS
jgi:uroporphyrinogen III methyltransferase/synthase